MITYHIPLVNVQTNYYNNNLLILGVKQLNKIMKLYYFYTLKALWYGQGKIKMYYGMSRVKKQLSGKRSITSKLLRKPVSVTKSLFPLFLHWFLTLSFFLIYETSHSNMSLQSSKWKFCRKLFLSYQKWIPPWIFSWSCNFLQVSASAANDFPGRTKRGKQHYYKKRQQIRYPNIFNIISIFTLLSIDAKLAIRLRVPSLTKLKYAISHCYIFSDASVWLMDNLLCLCDMWKDWPYVNSTITVSSIFNNVQLYRKYYFLHHRNPSPLPTLPSPNPPLKEIQLSVICYVSVLIFHQNAKTITFLYICSTWRNVPKLS